MPLAFACRWSSRCKGGIVARQHDAVLDHRDAEGPGAAAVMLPLSRLAARIAGPAFLASHHHAAACEDWELRQRGPSG